MIEINQVEFLVVSLVYFCFYDALTYGEVMAISPLKQLGVCGSIYTFEPWAISYYDSGVSSVRHLLYNIAGNFKGANSHKNTTIRLSRNFSGF